MVTKHQIKVIKSLGQKKFRQQLGLFVVEGIKGINEFLSSDFELENLFTTELILNKPRIPSAPDAISAEQHRTSSESQMGF